MNAERLPLLASLSAWMAGIGRHMRNLFAWSREAAEPERSADREFDSWVANDPMTTFNPASRYGDDATGFLGGSERDEAVPAWKDD